MTSLIEQVVHRIKQESIKPVTLWHFRFLRGLGWFGLLVSVLLASLFTAFASHVISEIDWEAYAEVNISWYQGALMALPFLWLVLVVFFLALATFFGERTRRGYRHAWWSFLGFFFVVTAGAGIFLENSRFDEPVENFFLGAVARHDTWGKIIPSAERQWQHPEAGLLGGEVMTVDPVKETLELQDKEKNDWNVGYKSASLEHGVKLVPTVKVNVIGKESGGDAFEADIIRKPKDHRETEETKSSVKGESGDDGTVKEEPIDKSEVEDHQNDEPSSSKEDDTQDQEEEGG